MDVEEVMINKFKVCIDLLGIIIMYLVLIFSF